MTNLTVTTVDLGTLGGRFSVARAVDGTVVVGQSRTTSGRWHAFAYDLAAGEPAMLDLGTLGGTWSDAKDVSGSIVVGTASNTAGDIHAFAYDLSADEPVMQDLGTLGGASSWAAAVDGTIVVGNSSLATGPSHAFSYDLAADEPAMQDLGTLGGGSASAATAVDGSIVAGRVSVPPAPGTSGGSERHAFAYDLAADEPEMLDLGTLGGRESFTTAVDGSVVVGLSNVSDTAHHAFAYDLAADEPEMLDLGVINGDTFSASADIDGNVVVGTSSPGGLSKLLHPFAYDLHAPEPTMQALRTMKVTETWATRIDGAIVLGKWYTRKRGSHAFAYDLGATDHRHTGLGTWQGSEANDVHGDVVVGQSEQRNIPRATAWILRKTTRPMFAFKRFDTRVSEGVGRARVTVTRYGRLNRAVTVRYRTHSDSARAGQDFVATSGKLRFGRGVTRRTFTVKIKNDRRPEKTESLLLLFSRPSSPSVLGTPGWSQIRIRDNDR